LHLEPFLRPFQSTAVFCIALGSAGLSFATEEPFTSHQASTRFVEARELLEPMAERGDATAQFNLGVLYEHEASPLQDHRIALMWYRRAAAQGHASACFNLGQMLATGRGTETNFGEAAKWYRRAAERGRTNAQLSLGLLYAEGKGVKQDFVTAYKWLHLATTERGPSRELAIEARDAVATRMTRAQRAEARERARHWRPR
jgi:TPR repeat protein